MSGSVDEPFVPRRKKLSVLWWIAGFFFLLLVFFFFQLFGPNPRIVVSKQTTFITEPLGPDGLPDYEQYVLDLLRDGVTPENNAVALMWQALFPADVDPKFHAAVAAELGLDEIPLESEALASYHSETMRQRLVEFLSQADKNNANTEPSATDDSAEDAAAPDVYGGYTDRPLGRWEELNPGAVDKLLDDVLSRPWTSEQVPPLAEWAKANQAPIDLLVEASRRPRYYAPSETLINNDRDLLVSMLLPMIQNTRDAGRALSVRAMWHLGEGQTMDAWQDILAIHRLSHLVTQGFTLVEQLVALALSGIACDCTVTFLDHAELTPEQARQVHRDLAGLPNFAVMARSLNTGERLMALDAFTRMGSGGGGEMFSGMTGGGNDFGKTAFDIVSVDWNLTLRDANRWYDRLVAAAQLPDREARVAALAKIDPELQLLVTETRTPTRLLAGVVSRRQRSQIVSAMMLGLFLPALNAAIEAEDRQNTTLELTRLALALAVYRAEHGAYPESIDNLVPGVIERLPVEVFSAKPFVYKRSADGFLLYGVGANGIDEGGSNERQRVLNGVSIDSLDEVQAESQQSQIPMGADDNSILVPRPAFELPKLQTIPQ